MLLKEQLQVQAAQTKQEAAKAREAGDVLVLVFMGGFVLVMWSALQWQPSLMLLLITWIGVTTIWGRLHVYLEESPSEIRVSRYIWTGLFLVGLILLGMAAFSVL